MTDTLQTLFMLVSLVLAIVVICRSLGFDIGTAATVIKDSEFSRVFDFDWRSGHNSIKQILAGIAITVSINGLDQNMMQKNLTCKTLKGCKTNMYTFSFLFFITNILFLSLGALLYIFASWNGIVLPEKSDDVFAFLSLNHFGVWAALFFLLGITAAAYSSVDSSLTSLTTSFCIDFLKINPKDTGQKRKRIMVHIGFSLLMSLVIVLFRELNSTSVVSAVLKAVGYTYGPILGLFAFGLLTSYRLNEKYLPFVCLLSPALSYLLNCYSEQWFGGYKFGFEILLVNGMFCLIGLFFIRKPGVQAKN